MLALGIGKAFVCDLRDVEMSHQWTWSHLLHICRLKIHWLPEEEQDREGDWGWDRQGESYLNLLSIQSDSIRLVSAPEYAALEGFVLVKPSWATFRNAGLSWREWALTAVAIKWKPIRGPVYGLWNSTALWGQISCPLHRSIQGHWFLLLNLIFSLVSD